MNILYIEHYAGGGKYGMEYRPYYLSREWIRMGHKVFIVGANFSHLRLQNPTIKKDVTIEQIDGINYIWFKTPKYESSIKRIINMVTFVEKLKLNATKLAKLTNPDIVIASSTYPLDIYPAHRIARMTGAKLCYEIHDIWPLSPMVIGGYTTNHPFIRVMQKAEDDCYKYCDKVISLLWNAEEHCRERGLTSGKFACVPNGFSKDEWNEDAFNTALPEEHRRTFDTLKEKVIVGFAGSFTASGALDNIVNTAELIKNKTNIHFVLVGKGPLKEDIQQMINDKQLSNVTLLPAVPKTLIPAVNSRFDIAYMGGVHSLLHQYGTSYNKMTDYMLSGKPIIQAIDEPGCMAEKVGCGIQVEAENPKLTSEAILKMATMSADERNEMGRKGTEYAKSHLDWAVLAKAFLTYL